MGNDPKNPVGMPPTQAGPSVRGTPQRAKPVDVGDDGTRPEEQTSPTATKPGEPQAAMANKPKPDEHEHSDPKHPAGSQAPKHKGHDKDDD